MVTSIIHKEPEIMPRFAVLIAGWESEILPTDWGEKHPDGRVWKSHAAERRRDNPSEREFIKVRYCIHNHTFWTKLKLCEIKCFQSRVFVFFFILFCLFFEGNQHFFFFLSRSQVGVGARSRSADVSGDEWQSTEGHEGQTEPGSEDSCWTRWPLPHQNQPGGKTHRTHQVETDLKYIPRFSLSHLLLLFLWVEPHRVSWSPVF